MTLARMLRLIDAGRVWANWREGRSTFSIEDGCRQQKAHGHERVVAHW